MKHIIHSYSSSPHTPVSYTHLDVYKRQVVTGVIRPIGLMCIIWPIVLIILIVRPTIVIIAVIWLAGRIVICSIMRLVSRVIRIVTVVIIRTVVIVVILVAVLKIFVFAPVGFYGNNAPFRNLLVELPRIGWSQFVYPAALWRHPLRNERRV